MSITCYMTHYHLLVGCIPFLTLASDVVDDAYSWKSSTITQPSSSLCHGALAVMCRLSNSCCKAEQSEGYLVVR